LKNRNDIFKQSDILINVWSLPEYEYKKLRKGQILIANFQNNEQCSELAEKGVSVLALEKVPRISRAQNIDILSSQNNLAGYKAALTSMNMLNRAVPMMITSAGTIKPVKVLIVGVGVAGLQALATYKRMGAIVYASDTRAETKEEIISVGGRFVEPDKQLEILKDVDILMTSVMPQGKPAPLLFTKKDLEKMPPNSVIVDLSCANVEPHNLRKDIKVVKNMFFASEVASSASKLFSENVFNLIKNNGGVNFSINLDDEIFKAMCLCDNFELKEV
jgi:NAD(P) transhydrogenase subunit alpha